MCALSAAGCFSHFMGLHALTDFYEKIRSYTQLGITKAFFIARTKQWHETFQRNKQTLPRNAQVYAFAEILWNIVNQEAECLQLARLKLCVSIAFCTYFHYRSFVYLYLLINFFSLLQQKNGFSWWKWKKNVKIISRLFCYIFLEIYAGENQLFTH